MRTERGDAQGQRHTLRRASSGSARSSRRRVVGRTTGSFGAGASPALTSVALGAWLATGCAVEWRPPGPAADVVAAADASAPTPPARRRAFVAARMAEADAAHALRWIGPVAQAIHPSMPLCARFDEHGVWLADRFDAPSWAGQIRVAAVGRAGAMVALDAVAPQGDTHHVEYRRAGSTEWYLHGPLGIEQGLELTTRPSGESALVVEVELGALRAEISGGRVTLSDARGVRRATLSDLFAIDARGERLEARFDVRHGRLRYVVDDAGATYPLSIDPLFATEDVVLRASSARHLGASVAIDGDTAIVGAEREAEGRAYVFVRTGSIWVEQAILRASDAADGDQFGGSVALDGDTAIIGAHRDDHGGVSEAGSAYVFVRDGSTWSEHAILRASEPAGTDWLGRSVALQGDTALVGASLDTHSGAARAGSVHVFTRTGSSWSEEAILHASAPTSGAYFGVSVDLDGDTALIGAVMETHSGLLNAGSAYVFVRSAGSWSEEAILRASDAAAVDAFGNSVAVHGDTALVGAWRDDHSGVIDAGSAYVFVRSGSSWSEEAILRATAGADDQLGSSVDLDDDRALVGAYLHDPFGLSDAGGAFVYERRGATWSQEEILHASDGVERAWLGRSVALEGAVAVVGAPEHLTVGGAYVFEVSLRPRCTRETAGSEECPCASEGAMVACDDGDPFTVDRCVDALGCAHVPAADAGMRADGGVREDSSVLDPSDAGTTPDGGVREDSSVFDPSDAGTTADGSAASDGGGGDDGTAGRPASDGGLAGEVDATPGVPDAGGSPSARGRGGCGCGAAPRDAPRGAALGALVTLVALFGRRRRG